MPLLQSPHALCGHLFYQDRQGSGLRHSPATFKKPEKWVVTALPCYLGGVGEHEWWGHSLAPSLKPEHTYKQGVLLLLG